MRPIASTCTSKSADLTVPVGESYDERAVALRASNSPAFAFVTSVSPCLLPSKSAGPLPLSRHLCPDGFFNIRNGQLQTDNINLQARLQEEYNSASLQITCPNIDCTQMFKVTNTGFGEAKSVNIIIALSSVPLPWTPYVNNINQFQLSVRPFSYPVRIALATNTSVNALPNNKSNAYILSLDNLGPQSSITVNISPDNLYNSIKNIIHGERLYNAIVYFTASEIQTLSDPNNIHEIINDIIDSNFFGIAKFVIDASCSTCSGDTSYASYPTFKASTSMHCEMDELA
jgi:hypothetical protein